MEVYVTVKGFDVDPPFYRAVDDDPPERRRESFDMVLAVLLEGIPEPEDVVITTYPDIGLGLFRLDLEQVERVAAHPRTFAVSLPLPVEPLLQAAVPRTEFPSVHALGLRGQGTKVAVIDTSFYPGALDDVIVERHCFCGSPGAGCCANGQHEQHAGTDAATIPSEATNEHAAFVASVIANSNNGGGGAPQAGIVAIAAVTSTAGESEDVVDALSWLQSRADIPVVNMSWYYGNHGSIYPGQCNGVPELASLQAAVSALHMSGKLLVAASGNNSDLPNGMSSMRAPACLSPSVISVAGTWNCPQPGDPYCPPGGQVDRIWPDSNTSPVTDVAAPAGRVWLHTPHGGFLTPENGTSFAAPLVAACAVLLKQAVPEASPEHVRAAIRATTTWATRMSDGQTYRFLDCEKSLDHLLTSTGIRLNQHGLTGVWYNPATPGQGAVLEVYEDAVSAGNGTVFGGMFTFATTPAGGYDKQRWYALSGNVNNTAKVANLTLTANYGGNFDAPPPTGSVTVGSATLHFDTCNRGLLTYAFDPGVNGGASGAIPFHRLLANPGCSETGGGSTSNRFKLSGTWHEPATSGQGLLIEINPDSLQMFAGWFTYAPDGQSIGGPESQRWYSLQATIPASGNTFSNLPIYGTTGGILDDSNPVATTQVGLATLSFSSCSAATLSYSFTGGPNAGLSGVVNLSRTGPVPFGCTL